ncbi:hypothetical protein FA95DRAFT_940893 [Auriscalpium vulgare]|uniref:Uncharacterized protein n=1 Tax=Auriscalpium vulgare TaxID=40419 RepID=A0ACB8S9X9_9AGAM|nr:hypothetical protein FA95DRAFT_940893 [Auriscalpium vulgare]
MNNSASSPSVSPPSLLSSSNASYPSTSTKSGSPPRTPPRGRRRYPAALTVDPTRVPLHRRGTSKTYERLEDLLKEAGYKETRVFTPEAERQEQAEEERRGRERGKKEGPMRGGVGAVVDFITGLVQGQASGSDTEGNASALKTGIDPSKFVLSPPSSASDYSSSASSSKRAHTRLSAQERNSYRTQEARALRPQASQATYSQTSPARAMLRHMASAPTIPRRRATPHHGPPPMPQRALSLDDGDDHPPLPPSWLESVARALLGVPGTYAGGPVPRASTSSSSSNSRSNGSRARSNASRQPPSRDSTIRSYGHYVRRRPATALSDHTNKGRGRSSAGLLQPPALLLGATRAQTSPGLVVKTQVVCRSAPASRSSSRVGVRLPIDDGSVRGKGAKKAKRKGKGKGRDSDVGPSLSTRVEADGWDAHKPGPGLLDFDGASSSSDEEGEVDLRKMLVHPKRQQSIASLRRHLERPARAGRPPLPPRAVEVWLPEDDDAPLVDGRAGLAPRSRRGSMNEGEWAAVGTTFGRGSGRRRRVLPHTWTQGNGGG